MDQGPSAGRPEATGPETPRPAEDRGRARGGRPPRPRNRFGRMEWAGAFGDLGTLIPFVVAYIGVAGVDPFGILFGFGVALIVCGLYYRTPFPVQPMKAIGAAAATQAAQTAVVTPGAIYGAGLVTGLVWLVLGLTGAAGRIARFVGRPVLHGIILGLGMGFMLGGVKMMAADWLIASIGLAVTVLLLTSRRIPAMLLLLALGVVYGAVRHPELVKSLGDISIGVRAPSFALAHLSWSDLLLGTVVLALPQVPLTLGNAVIAIRAENNRLFPDRPVSERKVAVSTGLLNLFGSSVGGVPMCHGAGGMAGHVAFGARTGGAPIILGAVLLTLAVFFSGSVELLFRLLPEAVLGVVLLLTGAQLALGSGELGSERGERFITLLTAAFALWNVGIAFVVGMAAFVIHKRGWLRI